MTREERRAKAREDLLREYKSSQSSEKKDSRKYLDLSIVKSDKKDLFYKPKAGQNFIDIIPFFVKTDNHPNKTKSGDESAIATFYVHTNVGPDKSRVLCMKRGFGKKCYICDYQEDLGKDYNANEKEFVALYPKKRFICNVIDLTLPEDKQHIQIFEDYVGRDSDDSFYNELMDEAIGGGDKEEIVTFADLEFGNTIKFKAVEAAIGEKGKFFKYKNVSFEDRPAYTEDIMKKSYALDELFNVLSYEEVRDMFHGVGADEPETPVEKTEEKVISRRQRTPEPEEKKESKEPSEDPEEERPRRNRERSSPECPHGHRFGHDNDETKDCGKCDVFDPCANLYDEINKKK